MKLADGTVIPSFLGVTGIGHSGGADAALLTNYVLRYGEVRGIVYPTSSNSLSKTQIEYDVEIVHRSGLGPSSTVLYRGVTISNLFGGFADRLEYTLRPDTSNSKDGIGTGSKVLLLCVSGDQSKAIILGGVRDQKLQKNKDSAKQGHNLFFEFNGAQFTVNDEGETQFLHKGPTGTNGKTKDQYEDYAGSLVRFDKRGNITVSGPGGEQFLKLVNQNTDDSSQDNSIQVQADKLLKVHVAGQAEYSSTGNTFIDSDDGGITLTAKDGVFVGTASDYWVKGTTYRLAEGSMNQTVATNLTSAASLTATASGTLMTAAGLNAIPMVGGILAMPAFIALAGQLAALGVLLGTMGGAINAFEAYGDKYLSDKNKAD